MPKYMIERTYTVDQEQVPTVAQRSRQLAFDKYPGIVWEHSHVIVDDEGRPRSYCVYEAPDRETVENHARELGDHVVDRIYEIAGDVTPADFPLSGDRA